MKNRKTLLIVEDEVVVAIAQQEELEECGYHVLTALSGEAALEICRKQQGIDLILMDINLGRGIDGTRTAELILQEKDIPVVFLSSYTEPEIVEKTEKITSYGYVVKNSGVTVLDASIKMAFKLYEEKLLVQKQREELEVANEELQQVNEELYTSNEQLEQSQQELLESEAKFYALYTSMNEGVCLHEIIYDDTGKPVDYRILDFNPLYEKITQITREMGINKIASELYGTGEPPFLDIYARVAETGSPEGFESYFPPMQKHFSINVFSPGKGKFATVFHDITEQKHLEQTLRREKEITQNIMNVVPAAVTRVDRDGKIIYANQQAETILGIELSVHDSITYNDPKWRITDLEGNAYPEEELPFNLVRSRGEPVSNICHAVELPGSRRVLLSINAVPLFDSSSEFDGMVAGIDDITEQKRTEEEIKSARDFMDTIFEMSPFAMWISDKNGTIIRTNRSLCDTINLTDDKITGKYNVLKDTNLENQGVMPSVRAVFEEYKPVRFNIFWEADDAGDVDFSDARDMHIDVSMFPILDAKGGLSNVVCQWIDISEQKRTEEELKKREKDFSSLVENANDMIVRFDAELRHIYCNKAVEKHWGIPGDSLLGKSPLEAFGHSEQAEIIYNALKETLESGVVNNVIQDFPTLSGEKYFETNIVPERNKDNEIESLLTVTRDVTSLKLIEEELHQAYEEKQALLKELHHRAKNSFLLINSMVRIMEKSGKSDEVRAALSEIGSRIKAVSVLFELLYESESVRNVRLNKYLGKVVSSLPGTSENISLETSFDPVTLSAKTATSLGIITSELIMNSIKHAFSEGEKGIIKVLLTKLDTHRAVVEVSDNGKGLPEMFDCSKSKSMGLKLVETMTSQIEGKFRIESECGIRCIVEFPLE